MFHLLAVSAVLSLLTPGAQPTSAPAEHATSAAESTQYAGIGFDYFLPANFPTTEHSTTAGPVVASNGYTNVVIYQAGRYFGDAAAALQFSTQFNGGPFRQGFVPGLTKATNPANPYDRITYETIVYNTRYHNFLLASLPISNAPDAYGDTDTTLPPVVSRSFDGISWSNPTPVSSVAAAGLRPEKNWVTCDNNYFSRYWGRCYIVWDDNDEGDVFHAAWSGDGGQTWNTATTVGQNEFGAVPVVLPNGNIVATSEDVSAYDQTAQAIISTVSTDGGQTWSNPYEVSPLTYHTVGGGMRTQPLPTSAADAAGNVYAIWQDCRFEPACASNDLVLSVSRDGVSWSSPQRLPLKPIGANLDLFLPSVALRNSGFATSFGLEYYEEYPLGCSPTTCSVVPMFYQTGWGHEGPEALAAPAPPVWLATTEVGYMVGDYMQATYSASAFQGPVAIGLNPAFAPIPGDSLFEPIVLPYHRGQTGLAAPTSSADTTPFNVGGRPVYQAARLAPKVKLTHHIQHPM